MNGTIFSYFGTLMSGAVGGLIVAIYTSWMTDRGQRQARQAEYTASQLKHFYGPIHFLLGQNKSISSHQVELQGAYREVYENKQWADDPVVQQKIQSETSATIEMGNTYTERTIENNRRILQIMSDSYSYIDPRDAETCQQFALNAVRYSLERGDLRLPHRVERNITRIVFYDSRFADLMRDRFKEKSVELAELRSQRQSCCARFFARPQVKTKLPKSD